MLLSPLPFPVSATGRGDGPENKQNKTSGCLTNLGAVACEMPCLSRMRCQLAVQMGTQSRTRLASRGAQMVKAQEAGSRARARTAAGQAWRWPGAPSASGRSSSWWASAAWVRLYLWRLVALLILAIMSSAFESPSPFVTLSPWDKADS